MSDAFAVGTCVKATLYEGNKKGAVIGRGMYQHATRHGHCLKRIDEKGYWTTMEVPSACVLYQVRDIPDERAFTAQYILDRIRGIETSPAAKRFLTSPAVRRLLASVHASKRIKRAVLEYFENGGSEMMENLRFLFGSIDDVDLLKRVIRRYSCSDIGVAAVKALSSQEDILEVGLSEWICGRALAATVDRVKSQEHLHRLATTGKESAVRERATRKLTRLVWLVQIEKTDRSGRVRTAARRRAQALRKDRDRKKASAN
jgi:hypothetical protein